MPTSTAPASKSPLRSNRATDIPPAEGVRVLITGAGGFVGPYLTRELAACLGSHAAIVPTSRDGGSVAGVGDTMALDVTDGAAVMRALRDVQPSHIIHLAAVSSLSESSADTKKAWQINTLATIAVAEAILRQAPGCWLIFAGSGLVYGDSGKSGRPLDERCLLAPTNDYAATKAAADLALGALTAKGLKSVRLRLFNHTGPGQSEAFAVSGFAAQIARIEAGRQLPVIRVGNLDAARDFLDVRDIAAAYALTVLRAAELYAGIIINIASGEPRTIRSVLDGLLALSHIPIICEIDPARLRSSDTSVYVGDPTRARSVLGWQQRYAFSDTLANILTYWRSAVGGK